MPGLRTSQVRLIRRSTAPATIGNALGAGITRLTGMNPVRSGLRQLGFGATATTITFGIGVAVGTALR